MTNREEQGEKSRRRRERKRVGGIVTLNPGTPMVEHEEPEVPVVVQCLGLLLGLINLILCLPALPICILCKLTENVVKSDGLYKTWTESRLRDYLYFLWLPRFLATFAILGLLLGQVIAVVLIAEKIAHVSVGIQAGIGIGATCLLLYGSTVGSRVGCLKYDVKQQIGGMVYSFLDAVTFLVAAFTTMCLVRSSALCAIGEVRFSCLC